MNTEMGKVFVENPSLKQTGTRFKSVWVCLTYRCNNDCKWCYVGGDDRQKDMHSDTLMDCLRLLTDLGVQQITFIGAESSLHPEIEKITQYVTSTGITSGMVTNGRRFSYRPFALEMRRRGLRGVGITVLGREQTHDEITRTIGSYQQTVQGIRNCVEVGMDVTINTTISYETQYELDDILDLSDELGVRKVFLNVCTALKPERLHAVSPRDAGRIAKELIERNEHRSHRFRVSTSIPVCNFDGKGEDYLADGIISGTCCVFHGSSFALDHNGDVLPCPHFPGFRYFNIFEGGGIMPASRFRDCFANGNLANALQDKIWRFPSDSCTTCDNYGACMGGCPIYWFRFKPNQEIAGKRR